jgi:transcription elongation factor GreA
MNNLLTESDIRRMKDEIHMRRFELEPKQLEAVKEARELGDLSENDEYRSAKRELNSNRARIRYLENMIRTATVIEPDRRADTVGLYDEVEIYYIDDDELRTITLVSTVRKDIFSDCISNESPLGSALFGAKIGDTVTVHVNDKVSYDVEIRSIKKGSGESDIPISSF